MLRTLDRYILREIIWPCLLALTVLTFILVLPPLLQAGEEFIAKGVEWAIVARAMLTLLPSALSLTIPMAVLIGVLVGFGRLSGDREFVAMQACGIGLARLFRPVALCALLGTAATAYEIIVALPQANQSYREIVYVLLASRVEHNITPRVFYEDFPDKIIYVSDLPATGGWRHVFVADASRAGETTTYFAREGRIRLDEQARVVQLELTDGTAHVTRAANPDAYEATTFSRFVLTLDPNTVFRKPPAKGAPEMTIAELQADIASQAARHDPAYASRFMLQQKFSLPLTCPILALIGLALGATSRKDGRLASFSLGIAVIFVYYILLWGARAAAMGGQLNASLAPWVPNLVMGGVGVALFIWRNRRADQPLRLPVAALRERLPRGGASSPARRMSARRGPGRLLDRYISLNYLRVFLLGLVGLLGVFYISTFIDLVDKVLRGDTSAGLLLAFFYYRTPQFIYYIIPMSVLVTTLVTVGMLTRQSELIVMRACGISLYRTVLPLFLFAALGSVGLFALQEGVLARANRSADRVERQVRHFPAASSVITRRWLVGAEGALYHFDGFDPTHAQLRGLWAYQLDPVAWQVREVTYVPTATAVGSSRRWTSDGGWTRQFPAAGNAEPPSYRARQRDTMTLEVPGYFVADQPIPDAMTYAQLRAYIDRLVSSGMNAVPQVVALHRKVAFPFVTIVMTLLAVPFAVTTGRHGAMYGIGVGIVLAITYWLAMSVTGALGAGGALPPVLAAWTPNVLFGAAGLYLLLRVRT